MFEHINSNRMKRYQLCVLGSGMRMQTRKSKAEIFYCNKLAETSFKIWILQGNTKADPTIKRIKMLPFYIILTKVFLFFISRCRDTNLAQTQLHTFRRLKTAFHSYFCYPQILLSCFVNVSFSERSLVGTKLFLKLLLHFSDYRIR